MATINVGVIGTGWCGGIRARSAAGSPLVNELHIAETSPERLAEVASQIDPVTATPNWEELLAIDSIDALMISATPEITHYPMAKASLEAGKHVLLEKPISLTLDEADELAELADSRNLKFAIGYSQRFNPKQAMVKRSFDDGTLGEPVSALVSRHITRKLGDKIGGRIKLSPAAMESTHDIDFLLWVLAPAKPVRVYAQAVEKVMKPRFGTADCMWTVITMDNGVVLTVGGAWIMPNSYPNYSSTWMEILGSEGSLVLDDSHRDVVLTTMDDGIVFPMSTMPGEEVGHVYAGPMHAETLHFLDAVANDKDVLVTAQQARQAMEVYLAADLSAETDLPVSLPMTREQVDQSLAIALQEA